MLGVMLMAWCIHGLLLSAVSRFGGSGVWFPRLLLGSFLGALAAGLSLLPELKPLNTLLGRCALLFLTCVVTFGLNRDLLWRFALFSLLHFSVGSLSSQAVEPVRMLLGTAGISLTCRLTAGKGRRIPVELSYRENHLHVMALHDTGNALIDPVTGQGVLILDASSSQKLTGLTPEQLNTPIESLEALPGLQLIPYHTVGNNGFLLALRLPDGKIGKRQGSVVVAFSPQSLGKDYQALTGGNV